VQGCHQGPPENGVSIFIPGCSAIAAAVAIRAAMKMSLKPGISIFLETLAPVKNKKTKKKKKNNVRHCPGR